jgi:hypothetical protein
MIEDRSVVMTERPNPIESAARGRMVGSTTRTQRQRDDNQSEAIPPWQSLAGAGDWGPPRHFHFGERGAAGSDRVDARSHSISVSPFDRSE